MFFTVYQTTNTVNQKIYIGTHITNVPDDNYLGSGLSLQRAIRKHGRENFIKRVLFIFNDAESMFSKEKELVDAEFVAREDTYNINIGGNGGWDCINFSCNPDIKLTLDENRQLEVSGFAKLTPDQRCKFGSIGGKKTVHLKLGIHADDFVRGGYRLSDEHKAKIGKANAVRQAGNKNSQYGTKWINDGTLEKKIKSSDLEKYVQNGWTTGRIKEPTL